MLYAGLDLSRKRLDVEVRDGDGAVVAVTAVSPDADGLRTLVQRLEPFGRVRAAIGRSANAVESGQTALLEVMTHEEPELALGQEA